MNRSTISTKFLVLLTVIFSVIFTLASAAEIPHDADTQLLLRFDNDLLGEQGEMSLESAGVSFEEGLNGQGVYIARPGGYISYSATDNITALEGTIEFWFKPNWDGDQDLFDREFFSAGNSFNNGMVITLDGANNLRFIRWGDDPDTPATETDVEKGVAVSGADLKANRWYHLAVTWKAGERLVFYRDGQVVSSREDGVIINSFTGPNIQLGSAEGTFDELRISSRQRSDGEILGDYYAGLGINAMITPTGLSIDRKNRIVIAESGANQVSVLSEDGTKLFGFGITGSASVNSIHPGIWTLMRAITSMWSTVETAGFRYLMRLEYTFTSLGQAALLPENLLPLAASTLI